MIDNAHSLFAYYTRRSEQEQIAAINATAARAADAHRRMSTILSAKAVLTMLDASTTPPDLGLDANPSVPTMDILHGS